MSTANKPSPSKSKKSSAISPTKKTTKKIIPSASNKKSKQPLQSNTVNSNEIAPYSPAKSESYMSESMQKHFQLVLQQWKQSLQQSMEKTISTMKESASHVSDISDRATIEEEFEFEMRERDRERRLLKKIELSLNMISEGNYGYCEACGEEIGLRRLEARPTATLCVDCKTLDEIREKQQRGG